MRKKVQMGREFSQCTRTESPQISMTVTRSCRHWGVTYDNFGSRCIRRHARMDAVAHDPGSLAVECPRTGGHGIVGSLPKTVRQAAMQIEERQIRL